MPLNLGNSGLLSQDPAYEKSPLYTELSKSYRWFDKVRTIYLNLIYQVTFMLFMFLNFFFFNEFFVVQFRPYKFILISSNDIVKKLN